jgi:hypothetical protein
MAFLSALWNSIQANLFPWLEEELGPLTEKQKQFAEVMEVLNPEPFLKQFQGVGKGRKPIGRLSLFKAFMAKAVHDFPTTELPADHLQASKSLRRLCGWENTGDIPSLSTFSRAVEQFSKTSILAEIHTAMIRGHYGDKLAGHVSRDATAIEAREKPVRKEKKPEAPAVKRKAGRPGKGDAPVIKIPKRLELQPKRTLAENLADLSRVCDIGTKKNSKGHASHWIGYKLHADVLDGEIPVSCVLTSASTHDSQAAIPLMQMTSNVVTSLYDLMDAAYDAAPIHKFSRSLGNMPLTDSNPRRKEKIPMEPARKARTAERTSSERVFSMLKDSHGGRNVRVKGGRKVMAHLMFGMLVIAAGQLVKLIL